ncbi:MAG TPA: twin-arginine translocase TatA/TatE family subunit [Opitutaceae bacterium]|nr:twin-arginine translocase TatA/TatE family subunit [Opitutaceae bacterium]
MNFVELPLAGIIGGGEWVWIFIIVLLLFGGAKLPALARGMGQAVKEFKKAQRDDDDEKPATDAKKSETQKTNSTPGSN